MSVLSVDGEHGPVGVRSGRRPTPIVDPRSWARRGVLVDHRGAHPCFITGTVARPRTGAYRRVVDRKAHGDPRAEPGGCMACPESTPSCAWSTRPGVSRKRPVDEPAGIAGLATGSGGAPRSRSRGSAGIWTWVTPVPSTRSVGHQRLLAGPARGWPSGRGSGDTGRAACGRARHRRAVNARHQRSFAKRPSDDHRARALPRAA